MDHVQNRRTSFRKQWRIAGWGLLALLLCLPAIAMQYFPAAGFNWTGGDFLFAAAMFGLVGTGFELAFRRAGGWAYRAAAGIAVLASFFLVWLNLAVGIIGNEDNPANWMFVGVLGIAMTGSLVARFGADGMSRTMALTAGAQAFVGVVALAGGMGEGSAAWPWDVANLTLFFTAAWGLAAMLFRKAARA